MTKEATVETEKRSPRPADAEKRPAHAAGPDDRPAASADPEPQPVELRSLQPKRRLGHTVAGVTAAVLVIGLATFLYLAWLLSKSPAPWSGSWLGWLSAIDPAGIMSAAIASAMLVAAIVGAVGIALAVRRQDVREHAYDFNLAAHETSRRQLAVSEASQRTAQLHAELAAQQADIDNRRLSVERTRMAFEQDLHRDSRDDRLWDRFAIAGNMLSSPHVPVRLNGVYTLASLADDWQAFGYSHGRQMCVSLLCDQLRLIPADQNEFQVHQSIVAQIRQHRPATPPSGVDVALDLWTDCVLDMTGAQIPGVNLIDTDLRGVVLHHANAKGASLANSLLQGSVVSSADFTGANLVAADFTDADMRWAKLVDVTAVGTNFSRADMREVSAGGSDFTKVDLTDCNVSGADFTGADLSEANREAAAEDIDTVWPSRKIPTGI